MLRARETEIDQTSRQGLTVWWALPWSVHLSTSDLRHCNAPSTAFWLVLRDGGRGQEALSFSTMGPFHHQGL